MDQERPSIRMSIGSSRSRSSDRSLGDFMDDFNKHSPRYEDLVYVMSIESERGNKNRDSDLLDRLDDQNKFGGLHKKFSNNENSGYLFSNFQARGGSFGQGQSSNDIGNNGQLIDFLPIFKSHANVTPLEIQEVHQCQCYKRCDGENCCCARFNQPCIEGQCCQECIQLKNRLLAQREEYRDQNQRVANHQQNYYSQQQQYIQPQAPVSSCACKKSQCLKMYCQCFANKGFCSAGCQCQDCLNKVDSERRRQAIQDCSKDIRNQDKGCHCRKTKCEKKYCNCYANGLKCTKYCMCENCHNMDEELKLLRKKSSKHQMQQQQEPLPRRQPCAELPTEIEFEMPEFGRMSLQDNEENQQN